jgi:hypothetical protein
LSVTIHSDVTTLRNVVSNNLTMSASDKLVYHSTNLEENLILKAVWIPKILSVLYQSEHNDNMVLTYGGNYTTMLLKYHCILPFAI